MGETKASPTVVRARELLRRLALGSATEATTRERDITEPTVALAGLLMTEANRLRSREETQRTEFLAALMDDPIGQAFTTLLTDRAFRSTDPQRIVHELNHLLTQLGTPRYLSSVERALLNTARYAGHVVPSAVQHGLLARLRDQTKAVILPGEDAALHAHLQERSAAGVAVNVNHLGEAVLSEQDALERVSHYCALLARPDVHTISVKVSSICSQLHWLAFDQTVERLVPRLRSIYEAAIEHGGARPKLVYLDMEAYRDLHGTLAVFKRVLSAPELLTFTAGIVLQAYLPDSTPLQRDLTHWAIQRFERGGAPIRLRIVKGANLAAELVESSLRGWPLPMFASKHETDASFKRMVDYACRPEHTRAVRLGIASHNAFDLAYGACVAHANGVHADVGFELLEGMADPLLRALSSIAGNVLVYAPIVDAHEIQNAIAYLIRRLDENTAPENFLRHSFSLRTNSPAWEEQEQRFRNAVAARTTVSELPRRTQDRRQQPPPTAIDSPFQNEPDTDFGLVHNREWITNALHELQAGYVRDVASHVASADRLHAPMHIGADPSRPGFAAYQYSLASAETIELSLSTAVAAAQVWSATERSVRDHVLHAVAQRMRVERASLITTMVLDAGKSVIEADVEVSEAIDFAEYYRRSAHELFARADVECQAKGVVLVTPPWNFPFAIPAGGVLAALATGNAVILKPALETALVGRRLCEAMWKAGVPRDVLQLVICDDTLGSQLIQDARVNVVVLTGASDTARLFRRLRPGLDLLAETGGKNAIVISAMSDWDLAIKELLQSAFGHSGQKCSAASLAICESEVYDSPSFQRRLRDAAESLIVGSAWSLDSLVTPLIHPPSGPLLRGLTQLDAGESWLLQPLQHPDNPRLWSPGIVCGVQAGSFRHQTELFGPVLGIMRANDLDHAIELANGTAYGLTSGLFSLNEQEQTRWADRIEAGNLYINRGITGAIVRRQPFGGTKSSSFGPGAKAGGPNYVAQFVHMRSLLSHNDYAACFRDHFSHPQDPSKLLGQDNLFSYVARSDQCVLVTESARPHDVALVLEALAVCNITTEFLTVNASRECLDLIRTARQHRHTDHHADKLVAHIRSLRFQRVRVIGDAPPVLRAHTHTIDAHIECAPVSTSGRVELAHYLRERSLSLNYHRYGNLTRI